VINEIDYDQVGSSDTAEFIEIYNPSGTTADLSHVSVMLVNGATDPAPVYATISLSSAGTLAAHNYLVIAGSTVNVPPPAVRIDPGWTSSNNIQNGSPDGVALVDTAPNTLIDALSYGGSITHAQLTGFATTVSLVEGTALSATDSNTANGSLCRSPNGQDTNNANNDWKFCSTVTAGGSNP
jgi:hypothetical protein